MLRVSQCVCVCVYVHACQQRERELLRGIANRHEDCVVDQGEYSEHDKAWNEEGIHLTWNVRGTMLWHATPRGHCRALLHGSQRS
jgi:hypothetical protein